jgi:hypothetical protein
LDIGHVKGFVEVCFPRVSHWNKRKGIVEKGFSNGRLERRPSLVNLRRIEPPRGKILGERSILGRWSHQMSFKMISSRKRERERPLGGVARQAKGKDLGYLTKVLLGYEEHSKSSPTMMPKFYSTSCRLEKSLPNQKIKRESYCKNEIL